MTDSTQPIFSTQQRDAKGMRKPSAFARFSLRGVVQQLHRLLGLSAGLVLAFMGITGSMMVFEDEIMEALSPQARVEVAAAAPLSPDRLLSIIQSQLPQDRITALQIESDPARAYAATVLRRPADGGRNPRILVNPYDGKLLGEATGADFFGRVRSLHRYLTASGASNDVGRHITGIAAISAVFFALSGLYLRWPRRVFDWRSWLRLDFKLEGRSFYRMLHSVIGSWVAIVYIISALSGLWWSYDWYRNGVTALLAIDTTPAKPRASRAVAKPEAKPAAQAPPAPVAIDGTLAAVQAVYGKRLASVLIVVPQPGRQVRARVLATDAGHDRALDDLQIDPNTGAVTKQLLYSELPPGEWIMANMDPIHTGILFGPAYRILLLFAALGLPFFAATGLLLYADRRKTRLRASTELPIVSGYATATKPGPLIVYASQTGAAEVLARRAVEDFRRAGIGARLASLAEIDGQRLQSEEQVLFIASTYGDGHAPDSARRFETRTMAAPIDLTGLRYGLLALGDRRHREFCAFGQRLDDWLDRSNAVRSFDRLDVDANNTETLVAWQHHLVELGASADDDATKEAHFQRWRLDGRDCLNPGSVGQPVFRIRLTPCSPRTTWQAGDIAEIVPAPFAADNISGLALREYSISSIPDDGAIVLIVRQVRRTDRTLGLGSGWLTSDAPIGETIGLRIRTNRNFHPPAPERPMILIGNGTGIAGLHAHLRHRAKHLPTENWLVFGERNRNTDFLMREELDGLQAHGVLQRILTAFSRDQAERIYVQHRIEQEADELRCWVDRGAAIYVCGSSDTMAPAVDETLAAILGRSRMEQLTADGLYRRDIY
jgi:sulfite reductase (NADPH) flavoprotein alpha-component